MPDIQWGNRFTVEDRVAALVDQSADKHRVPRNVARAFVIAESFVAGRVDGNAHNTSGEDSVGLLQLNRSGGQGAGQTLATLRDPASNLAIGMPFIGSAWQKHPELGMTRARVMRAAWDSGHPGNIDLFTKGSRAYGIAEVGATRIADVWEQLEGVTPTTPTGQIDGYRRIFDEGQRMINERPAEVVLAAVGAVVLLAVATA